MNRPQPYVIDEFDDLDLMHVDSARLTRGERIDVIEGACDEMRQRGFPIPIRYGPICDAFVEGEIDYTEFSRRINGPDLN